MTKKPLSCGAAINPSTLLRTGLGGKYRFNQFGGHVPRLHPAPIEPRFSVNVDFKWLIFCEGQLVRDSSQ
ncbi:MAG TPA: hypothetical protein VMY06_05720 [Sedimentisphaerales bacterium]|nr:hypothetical protein [Sedimentisphaerales bacterium]